MALRNINLIVQKRPEILQNEVRVFFCKYNDPIYVKMEKLEIMIQLANVSVLSLRCPFSALPFLCVVISLRCPFSLLLFLCVALSLC